MIDPVWAKKRNNSRRKVLLVRCGILFTLVTLSLATFLYFRPQPPPKKEPGEFDDCAEAIEAVGVPTGEKVLQLQARLGGASKTKHGSKGARQISAEELMDMVDKGKSPSPWIVHQSWKDGPLPEHFERWSKDWKKSLNDDWYYVLWRDGDNRRLVETYYPKYLEVYDSLPREIYRADMVRNMYMHRFGGIYADLDLVPLRRLSEQLPFLGHKTSGPVSMAYVGHMGNDDFEHSIPNAFMASSAPYHPFWMEPLEYVRAHRSDEAYNTQPEGLTGPVALRACVKDWEGKRAKRLDAGEFAEITVLPNEKIYPFSWFDSPQAHKCLCRLHSPHFSEPRCKWVHPNAWTLTYWTHSWGF